MKEMTLRDVAKLLDGTLEGPEDLGVHGIAPLTDAGPGMLSFAVSRRMKDQVAACRASCILLPRDWPHKVNTAAIYVDDPYLAFAKVLAEFTREPWSPLGVMDGATIAPDAHVPEEVSIYNGVYVGSGARIGERVTLYPGVFIGNGVEIGDDTIIHPNVTIYPNTVIGCSCIIHAGAVIGSDGFGYAQDRGRFYKIPQVGRVVVEDQCEIGANVTIDRGTLGETRISRGVKIDNLVQIAHNCTIGPDSVIVSQVGIAGSTSIGANCMLGGQVGIVGHITIGDRVKIGAQSGVAQDIPSDSEVSGSPAMPHRTWLRVVGLVRRLPELFRDVAMLKKAVFESEK